VTASEERLWAFRRIELRLGICALIAPFALYFVPNLIAFGKWTRLSPADFAPFVEHDCVQTVRAIKEYQRDYGQLPDFLQDLVPRYLTDSNCTESIVGGQSIYNGKFKAYDWHMAGIHVIYYEFTPDAEGWYVQGPIASGPIPVPPVTINPATQNTP
jgi:hypothetical protein